MEVKILKDNQLTQADRKQIHRLDLTCFGQKAIVLEKIYYFTPSFKHLLMFDKGKLVSYLRVILRTAVWNGQEILIGGIGSVETDPEYRGKGLASKLLREAMKILNEQGVDFNLLQTNLEKGAKLYGKFGFIPANRPYEVLDILGRKRTVKAKDVMLAPGKTLQLLDEIMNSDKVLFIGKGDW